MTLRYDPCHPAQKSPGVLHYPGARPHFRQIVKKNLNFSKKNKKNKRRRRQQNECEHTNVVNIVAASSSAKSNARFSPSTQFVEGQQVEQNRTTRVQCVGCFHLRSQESNLAVECCSIWGEFRPLLKNYRQSNNTVEEIVDVPMRIILQLIFWRAPT